MSQADAIAVEVTISPELRYLLAARAAHSAAPPPPVPKPDPAPTPSVPDQAASSGPPSSNILLRQDGAKPMRFRGSPVFNIEDRWPEEGLGFVHQFTLFLDDTGGICAAVRLDPDEGQCMRPSYRCATLENGPQLHFWLERWLQEVVGPALAQNTPYRRRAFEQVSAAFHSLTGHCLRSVNLSLERKERCLQ